MKRLLLCVMLASVSGCGISRLVNGQQPVAFTAPDGRAGFSLSCNADMALCHNSARAACGGNYEVINQAENKVYQPADQFNMVAGTITNRSMQVACSLPKQ